VSSIRVSLGEPLRFRVETAMRRALSGYAEKLAVAAGHPVSIGGAVRDLVARGLATSLDAGYLSGFREGFIAAYAETKGRLDAKRGGASGSPMRPRPTHDIEDYQGGGEGEP
jgi:hypothetical protein